MPKLFHLRMDPCERADITSDQYYWTSKNRQMINQGLKVLETFGEYPPSQKAPSFSADQIMDDVKAKIAAWDLTDVAEVLRQIAENKSEVR